MFVAGLITVIERPKGFAISTVMIVAIEVVLARCVHEMIGCPTVRDGIRPRDVLAPLSVVLQSVGVCSGIGENVLKSMYNE